MGTYTYYTKGITRSCGACGGPLEKPKRISTGKINKCGKCRRLRKKMRYIERASV